MRRLRMALLLLIAACDGVGGGGSGGAASGGNPFDEGVLATYELSIAPADWNSIIADPFNETWRRATLTWQGETFANVAVRPSGQHTRFAGNPKPSVRLSFEEFVPGRKFHGLPSLKLDSLIEDHTFMRERLAYAMYEARGVPAPREVHARLVINGSYRGLYAVEERLTKAWVERRFGTPANQLYEWTHARPDVIWEGPVPAVYVPLMWDPKIETVPPDPAGVMNLVDILNNNVAAAPGVFDVDAFINMIAVEAATGEGDGYIGVPGPGDPGFYTANLYMVRTPSGRYMMLPWDKGQAYSRGVTSAITLGLDQRILTRRLIVERPENLARFRQFLREIVEGPHQTATLLARIDFIAEQIRPAVLEDPVKPLSNEQWPVFVEALKNYIRDRNLSVLQQLGSP